MKVLKIKNRWLLDSDLRIDASFHLSDGPLTKLNLANAPCQLTTLKQESKHIFSGNIFKRTYVENPANGLPYITGSDMVKSKIDSGKYVSKKYTSQADQLRIEKDWILISCSGTIGNCVYTTEDFHGRIGTHDLIRVIPNSANTKTGYLYAYLSSKYGYGLLTQSSYGGVVKHIEPHHIENIPIPILPESKQERIHELIAESVSLRHQANCSLAGAQKLIQNEVEFKEREVKHNISKIRITSSHQSRFEAQYHASEGSQINNHIRSMNHKLLNELCKPIFRPGIFKRHYVLKGIDFLGGSDIVKAIPSSEKKLSRAKTGHLDSLIVKEDWILVTCGGTIGFSVLVDNYLAGKAASQHILRVIADNIPTGYLFAYMSSEIGIKAIQSFTYGSVIPQIEPHHLGLLPIPILDDSLMLEIHDTVMNYKNKLSKSILLELEAIALVEKEIESWHE
jgi:type I restriction enzyme, S subunit